MRPSRFSSRRLAMRTRPVALGAALALLSLSPSLGGAAVHTFTGSSSANWSAEANWVGGLPAILGEVLLDSPTRPASFNDIAGGLTLLGLTLGANTPAPTLSGEALRFQGSGAYLRMLSDNGHGTINNALALNSTLELTGGPSTASQLFLSGDISGGGGLTAVAGRTVLSGNNSYSGATIVQAGAALGFAGSALNGTSGIEVAAGGELQIVNSNVVTTLNKPIALGGRLSSSAGFVQTLFGAVPGGNVNGAITLTNSAEVIALAGDAANPVRFVVNGATDRAGQALRLRTTGPHNTLAMGTISGPGSLALRPDGGTITTGAVSGAGEVLATGNGGSAFLASLAGDGRVLVNFAPGGFGQLIISGALSGQRDLDVRSGTLSLASPSAQTFTGQITLHGGGTLSVGRESVLGSASPVLQFEGGGRLLLRDGFGLARNIVTTGGQAAVQLGGITNTVSSTISGDGGMGFAGRFITLTGNNSFAGGLAVLNDGTADANGQPNISLLAFNHDGNLGQAGAGLLLQGGLVLPDSYELSRPLTVSGALASVSATGAHTISSAISGDGRLNLGGAARYLLTGTNTHTGGVALAGNSGQAAELVLDSDARLGGPNGVLNIGRSSGFFTLPGTLVAAGNLNIAATRSTSFRDMTVDTNGFDVVFNQPIDGLGMTKTGAGTWVLRTANTNSSGDNRVDVLQGRLALGVDEALGTRSNVSVSDGAELLLGGRVLTVNNLTTQAGSRVNLGGGSLRPLFATMDGVLVSTGSLMVGRAGFSPGAVTLNGANLFNGSIEVTQGSRLTLGHVQALGAASNSLLLDNGHLEASNRMAAPLVIGNAMNLSIGPGGAGFVAGGQSIVIERALSGPLKLSIQGGSMPGNADKFDVRLTNAGNSFTGDLVLGDPQGFGSAVLGLTSDGALGAASNRLILGKSFFDGESTRGAQGGLRAWASFSLAADRMVLLDGSAGEEAGFIDTNGHTLVVDGSIGELASGLGLLKTGAGTLVLNGVQAYSGRTTVNEGTLGGHGEVASLSVQGAELAPGESAGLFSVREGLSFSSGALFSVELGGLPRGSGYDAVNVGGSVDLGGDTTLQLSFINGFVADAGHSFVLIDAAGGLSGSLLNVADGERLAVAGGAGSFVVHYGNGTTLSLSDFQAAAVPEPTTWGLMGLGLAVLGWRARRQRR
ncbi:MAG: autotransporter-associated beta strand repeat-containing protein [Roseateles sp.]